MALMYKSVIPDGSNRPRWHIKMMDRNNDSIVEVYASKDWVTVNLLHEMIDEIKRLDFTQNALKK